MKHLHALVSEMMLGCSLQVDLLQQNVLLRKAMQAASGKTRWREPRAVQLALGAMHSLILIYTPSHLLVATAGEGWLLLQAFQAQAAIFAAN